MPQNSISPVRSRKSPCRKSPSRRERSPARHRGADAEKLSSSNRSHKRSRSPELRPPRKERVSSRTKSPKSRKSLSPESHSPVRQRPLGRITSRKIKKSMSPPPPSHKKEKLPPRAWSPVSPSHEKSKQSVRSGSPRRARSISPDPKSFSPRSKRLLRAKAERDAEKKNVMEHEGNHGRKGERVAYKEKDSDREIPIDKKDKRSRDEVENGSSRSRQKLSASPSDPHHRSRCRSRSPSNVETRGRDEGKSSGDSEQRSRNNDDDSIAKMKAAEDTLQAKEKQKPSFELSGKLAAETNRFRGVTLLFNEPPDARKPDVRWRLYVFKGSEPLNEPLYVHRQSCYLFGRERRVADIPTDHPSCSKQHAVLQYRLVEEENPDNTISKRVRPYVMDLGSTNGTFINEEQIEPQRYYQLFEKDTIKFGNSSREYVLLHENSAA